MARPPSSPSPSATTATAPRTATATCTGHSGTASPTCWRRSAQASSPPATSAPAPPSVSPAPSATAPWWCASRTTCWRAEVAVGGRGDPGEPGPASALARHDEPGLVGDHDELGAVPLVELREQPRDVGLRG